MKKFLILLIIAVLVFPMVGCGQQEEVDIEKIDVEELRSEKEKAIKAASELYRNKNMEGMDFSAGPCLAEEIMDGWSVDIVHNPRKNEDEKPENQCQYYRKGKTKHFIELSVNGDLVRAK
jgi:hypothetical protein